MRSLLTELSADASPSRDASRALRDDVLGNLEALCRTRRGSSLVSPGFGMVDVLGVFRSSDRGAEHVRKALEDAVRAFEPRLHRPRVQQLPSEDADLTLRFEITGEIVVGGRSTPVRFETTYDAAVTATVR